MSLSEIIEELKKMRILENEIKISAISRGSIYELNSLRTIRKRIEILQAEISKYNEDQTGKSLGLVNSN